MNVLVTGGAGFIGSSIVELLIENGHNVSIVDNLSTGKLEFVNKKANFYCADINDDLSELFEEIEPEVVVHHAAQISVQTSILEPAKDANINITGTVNLLESCIKYKVRKIIYASSAAVYGKPAYLSIDEEHPTVPISFYGISKYTPENYIKLFADLYGIKYTILRYSNVYGPRQDSKGEGGVVSIFFDKLCNDEIPVIYGSGSQTRDFIYVKDVAFANLMALNNGDNSIANISSNKQTSVNELFEVINRALDITKVARYGKPRLGDISDSCLNNRYAKAILNGWAPKYSLQTGLAEMIESNRILKNCNHI
ncbi:NAD-dependent epimerase/dehydratase family protein [Paenibacillus sp. FJAT-26967]|uniref:NAD-dependent epimerase/dehydratase family protein n=1 Tax=Paenibacillus sp. FJAT-26967 TaxID=1729690 RepID=UPI000838E941|nr:NAD-dependent epimerase/dehydratase family protein [Paenibacillus sp. FJAT-26967]